MYIYVYIYIYIYIYIYRNDIYKQFTISGGLKLEKKLINGNAPM